MRISISESNEDLKVPLIRVSLKKNKAWSLRLIHFLGSNVIVFSYICVTYLLIGLRIEHVITSLAWIVFYNFSNASRKFTIAFSAFIIYWIVYDYLKAFSNWRYRSVSIKEIYEADKALFGINYRGLRLTHNEFWRIHENIILTLASGAFYLTWIPLPLSFALYLYFKRREAYYSFSTSFLINNLIGFCIYYLYPAAPPWYIEEVGTKFNSSVGPSSARLKHFDDYFHVAIFEFIYSKNSNIFASMPSLHVSYPSLVLLYSIKYRFKIIISCLFLFILFGI